MNNIKETKEKVCAFYVSDYHFEMISLPYINKKIENKENIIILTENNLEETIKTLLSKMNFKKEKKEKIFKLNWNNCNSEKLEKIQKGKETTIFIKGSQNYIEQTNQKIEKMNLNNATIKIVDCYNMEEIGENMDEIMKKYRKILRTAGECDRMGEVKL